MIDVPIGAGQTYTSIGAALTALNGQTLADNYHLHLVSNTTESGMGTASINLGGYTLTLHSDLPHGGQPTVGYKSTLSVAGTIIQLALSGSGTFEAYGLQLICTASGGNGFNSCYASGTVTVKVHDILASVATGTGINFYPSAGTASVYVWNAAVKRSGSNGFSFAFYNPYGGTMVAENCTAQGSSVAGNGGGFILNGEPAVIRNCVSFDHPQYIGDDKDFVNVVNATGYNNASEDASASTFGAGSGNITFITPASEFVSTTYTDADWVKLQAGGSLDDGGVPPGIGENTTGIRGNTRAAPVSIGADEYSAVVAPTFTSCTPNVCAVSGGRNVSIVGTGFQPGVTVTFGGTSATNVVRVSDTNITCDVPAHAAGLVNIVITNTDTGSVTATNAFTYNALPTFTSCTPDSGSANGLTPVSIVGTGFQTGVTVSFGGSAATDVVRVSATSITCKTPAHVPGDVNIVITNPDTGVVTAPAAYTFISAPTFTSCTPDNGDVFGGTDVAIVGTGFVAGATVTFGGQPAIDVTVVNATLITCAAPSHDAGVVDIVITNSDTGTVTASGAFTYNPAVGLKSRLTSHLDAPRYFSFLGAHGGTIQPGTTVVVNGDIRGALAGGNRYSRTAEMQSLQDAIDAGEISLEDDV